MIKDAPFEIQAVFEEDPLFHNDNVAVVFVLVRVVNVVLVLMEEITIYSTYNGDTVTSFTGYDKDFVIRGGVRRVRVGDGHATCPVTTNTATTASLTEAGVAGGFVRGARRETREEITRARLPTLT